MKICRTGIIWLLTLLTGATAQSAELADQWDKLLKTYVHDGIIDGVQLSTVNYAGIKKDPKWQHLLKTLSSASIPDSPKAQKAFWINAYNILAIKTVLSEYPIKSIKDVGPWHTRVWNVRAGNVSGKEYTLGHIEHEILRKTGDPLIHAAIVCASVSCPDLRKEAYRASRIENQLDSQMKAFLSNSTKGALLKGSTLHISAIFDFFTKDFTAKSGSLHNYLKGYLPIPIQKSVSSSTKIRYLSYDWSLNDSKRAKLSKQTKSSAENSVWQEQFSDLQAWKEIDIPGVALQNQFKTIQDNLGKALFILSENSASAICLKKSLSTSGHPTLRWSWRIDRFPQIHNPLQKSNDDFAVRIAILEPHKPGQSGLIQSIQDKAYFDKHGEYPPARGIHFVWTEQTTLPQTWTNPYTGRIKTHALRRGKILNEWKSEEVDLKGTWKSIFKRELPKEVQLCIMADTDNSKSKSQAWVKSMSYHQ